MIIFNYYISRLKLNTYLRASYISEIFVNTALLLCSPEIFVDFVSIIAKIVNCNLIKYCIEYIVIYKIILILYYV